MVSHPLAVNLRLACALLVASCAATPQAGDAPRDRTGSNPTVLLDTLEVGQRYASFGGANGRFAFTPTYAEANEAGTVAGRVALPFEAVDVGAAGEVGFGDVALGFDWLADRGDDGAGTLVRLDARLDTASSAALGAGRALLAPSVSWVGVLSERSLLIGTWRQTFSVDGTRDRDAVNQSALDLRYLRRNEALTRWWSVDPGIVADLEDGASAFGMLQLERGWVLGDVVGAALGAFVRPTVAIGGDRPYDWSLELGLRLVGI